MNELEAIKTPLRARELARLIALVEETAAGDRQHIGGFAANLFNDDELLALVGLGFLSFQLNTSEIQTFGRQIDTSTAIATLLPGAFHRYRHEKRNLLQKQIRLAVLNYKDLLGIAAFVISVILLILRILELAGYRLIIE